MEIENAFARAAITSRGRFDKLGNPIMFHPLRVILASAMPDAQIVTVLPAKYSAALKLTGAPPPDLGGEAKLSGREPQTAANRHIKNWVANG